MKQTYKLEYRTGWGERNSVEFEARTLFDAMTIARNYCTHHFIKVAWLTNKKGNRYAVVWCDYFYHLFDNYHHRLSSSQMALVTLG